MPHFFQKAQQVENRWLSFLLPSIVAVASLGATVDPVSVAEAAECQVTEEGDATPGMTTGKDTMLSILPFTITMERDSYGGFVSSPVRVGAPYMKNSRITISGACLSQDILKSVLFHQAMNTSIGKSQANARIPSMKVSALPYNGKKHVLPIRTIPTEIGVSLREKSAPIIGPVQEIRKPTLPRSPPQSTSPPCLEINLSAR
jgi:hypothetical protein